MGDARDSWRPSASVDVARVRADMLQAARAFFAEHDVLEVDTPSLSRGAVSDPQIESVPVSLSADPNVGYFLHTSPEFAMKRLLCAGWPDIFQICKVFRDAEVGRRHQPEFTMIEWYRRDMELDDMMQHTARFIERLLDRVPQLRRTSYVSYQAAFEQHAGVDPFTASIAELKVASGADADLARSLGDERDIWLDLLLTTRVAPAFAADTLTVLHHYPASQAALARLCPSNAAVADRFEVFFGELELANGYFELSDADEQFARCKLDQQVRQRRQQPVRALDEKFLASLQHGLPPCCGVAVGFDRLVMINTGATDLQDVQTFVAVEHGHD